LVLVAVMALAACASDHSVLVGRQEHEISVPDEPGALIQMRKNGCPDEACPVYGVAIFPDRAVVYDGRANVGVIGRRSLKLRPQDLDALISALDSMDFLDAPDNCCVCAKTAAMSAVTLDYRPGTVAKTVIHDQRCGKAPATFSALERQIDRATGAERLAALRAPGKMASAAGRLRAPTDEPGVRRRTGIPMA
jgi:hypothetical protein